MDRAFLPGDDFPRPPLPEDLIAALNLVPHPEGGAFSETYRSAHAIDVQGGRPTASCIYFMLRRGQCSTWHKVRHDEIWLFHGGDPLVLKRISPQGRYDEARLGLDVIAGERPQALVPGEWWQAAVPADGPHGWTLVGCVVSPGFDYADFELATEAAMQQKFPQCRAGIPLLEQGASHDSG